MFVKQVFVCNIYVVKPMPGYVGGLYGFSIYKLCNYYVLTSNQKQIVSYFLNYCVV